MSQAKSPAKAALRAFRLTLAYDGAAYFGWQRQPDRPSVQVALEKALVKLLADPTIKAFASSRTDTGVHALGQSVIFRTAAWSAPADRLPLAINTKLPADIVVRNAVEVPLSFHPLRDNVGKRYRYFVYCSRKADPIGGRTHWWVRQRMSMERLQEAARQLVGEHNFFSFQSTGSPRQNTIRHVRELTVTSRTHMDGELYQFDIGANGFLYNMVRNIVGTLVQISVGRWSPEWIAEILQARDRRAAGATAPPQGLFLMEVLYESPENSVVAATSKLHDES